MRKKKFMTFDYEVPQIDESKDSLPYDDVQAMADIREYGWSVDYQLAKKKEPILTARQFILRRWK